MAMNVLPVVMAGGIGKRLYPLSTVKKPKQFIKFFDNNYSCFQSTISRIRKVFEMEKIVICYNKQHKKIIKEQLKCIKENNYILIEEPDVNNTFSSLILALNFARSFKNLDSLFLSTSDSFIENNNAFAKNIQYSAIYSFLSKQHIIFGIPPDKANKNYGYIKINNNNFNKLNKHTFYKVDSFVEKPNLHKARQFIKNKHYLWNSGYFMFNIKTLKQEIKKYQPKTFSILKQQMLIKYKQNEYIANELFYQTPNIQIDKAIIEKSNNILCLKANFDWSDIGTFDVIYELLKADKIKIPDEQNYLQNTFAKSFLKFKSSL